MAQLPCPAAVDVTAVEEDCAAWEGALDVDDSDLRISPSPSSRPFRTDTAAAPHPDKPSLPSLGQRIPGPASAVQYAMRLGDSGVLGCADVRTADADFLLHPWLRALQFLGKDRAWEQPGIKRIKAHRELDRAPLVVGVVTSCKPNGLGDLLLMLKDPTNSINATVYRKVLLEGNFGQDISVGCVIILQKIVVFRPSHTACYLNITNENIVKVVRKDCDLPCKQATSSVTIGSQLPPKFDEVSRHSQGRLFSSDITSAHKSSSSTEKHPQQSFRIPITCLQPIPGAGSVTPGDRACTQASDNEKLTIPFDKLIPPSCKKLKTNAALPDCYDATMNTSVDTKSKNGSENYMDINVHDTAEPFHGGHSSTGKPDEHQQKDFCAANTGCAQLPKERSPTDAAASNRLLSHPKPTSVAASADWTDEQLLELLADY